MKLYHPTLQEDVQSSHTNELTVVLARVHNISKERESLTAHIPCTNAMRQVSPVNYRTHGFN